MSFFHVKEVDRFKLRNPRSFHYLNQSNCYELDGVDDSKEYLDTRRAMDVVGINTDEQVFLIKISIGELSFCCFFYRFHYRNLSSLSSQDAIFRIVAAVLHLGNIEFGKGVDEVEMDSSEPKDEQSRFHLKTAAELLM